MQDFTTVLIMPYSRLSDLATHTEKSAVGWNLEPSTLILDNLINFSQLITNSNC